MTFDEHLQEALDALSARLRDQLTSELRTRADELRSQFESESRRQAEDARRREDELRSEARAQLEQERQRAADELQSRIQDVRSQIGEQARTQVAAALAQLEDARAKAADARAQLEDARAKAADAHAQLENLRVAVAERQTQIEDERRKVADGQTQLADSQAQLAGSQAQLADAHARLEESRARADQAQARADDAHSQHVGTRAELESARAALDEAREALLAARAQAEETRVQLDDTESRLEDARAQVQEGRVQIEAERGRAEEARAEIEEIRARVDEARAERDDARVDVEDLRAQLDEARGLAEEIGRARGDADAAAVRAATAESQARNLAEAVRSFDAARSLGEVLDVLLESARRDAARAAVLLVRGGRFHGWRFAGFGSELDRPDAVSVPLHEGGVLAEAVQRSAAAEPGPDGEPGAPDFAGLPAGRACLAVPMALSGQTVAVLYADAGVEDSAAPGELSRSTIEVLARHAAQRLAVLTAFKAARLFAPGAPVGPSAAGAGRRADDEEESARRYARLLVSEIRLYHEADVAEGRERRDLGTRLASEIARARVLYEQRVSPDVRRRNDYFHAELVRTLADGDARLLEAARP